MLFSGLSRALLAWLIAGNFLVMLPLGAYGLAWISAEEFISFVSIGLPVYSLMFFCFLLYKVVTPLHAIIHNLEKASSDQLDLSIKMDEERVDELGDIGRRYNRFTHRLNEMVDQLREIDDHSNGKFSSGENSFNTDKKNTTDYTIDSVVEEFEGVESDNVEADERTYLDTVLTDRDSIKDVELLERNIDLAQDQIQGFSQMVADLDTKSRSIAGIVNSINMLANQTNLLALNAIIEAARAGEAGKGFAELSKKVSDLSENSVDVSEEITESLQDIMSVLSEVDNQIAERPSEFKNKNFSLAKTAAKLDDIIDKFGSANSSLDGISSNIAKISDKNRDVVEKIDLITHLSSALTREERNPNNKRGAGHVPGGTSPINKTSYFNFNYGRGYGRGNFEKIIRRLRQARDEIQVIMQKLSNKGVNFFDEKFIPVPDTNPQQYDVSYQHYFVETPIQKIYDRVVEDTPGALYVIAMYKKCYLPTHISRFSLPQTGDIEYDNIYSRDRRIYMDRCARRASANEASLLLQTYQRDTGEVLNDLAIPITVDGRHWGAIRIGFDPAVLLDK